MSYLKDLPCETCGTKSIYAFPNWPNVCYCYCSFRDEIGEQIAQEIEADHKPMTRQTYDGSFEACQCGYMSYPCQLGARAAAIARGEK